MPTIDEMPRVNVQPPSDEILSRVREGVERNSCESNSARYVKAVLAGNPSADCRLVGGLAVFGGDVVAHVWVRINGCDVDPTWHLLVGAHAMTAEYVELRSAPLGAAQGEPPEDEDGAWDDYAKRGLLREVIKTAQAMGLIAR